jgi:hypothetical protein
MAELKPIQEYTEKLANQGNLIWADALHPSSQGVRIITDQSGSTTVQKGPFDQGIGGYSVLNVASLEQAIELVKSGPMRKGNGLEIRQIINAEDFPIPEEAKAKGRELRKKMQANAAKLQK